MKKLKTLMVMMALIMVTGAIPALAQSGDSAATNNANSTTTSTTTTSNTVVNATPMPPEEGGGMHTRYLWIIAVSVIVVGFVVGYIVRSNSKKISNDPQTGGDINNPASGI